MILLRLRESYSYGYELMERLTDFGVDRLNPGTLYRALRQMEKNGLCDSKWETSKGGRARRIYSITDAGESYLELWAEALKQYQRNLETFFSKYKGSSAQ